jgi:hypothetical protein
MRPRFTRQEKRKNQENQMKRALSGTGSYIFENNTKGSLNLPKAGLDGKKHLRVKEQFNGDSYFLSYVGPPTFMIRLISGPLPAEQPQVLKENVMEKKLLVDQPDTFTTQGKVEHVVQETPKQKLNDSNQSNEQPKDILLVENPALDDSGIEIIFGQ